MTQRPQAQGAIAGAVLIASLFLSSCAPSAPVDESDIVLIVREPGPEDIFLPDEIVSTPGRTIAQYTRQSVEVTLPDADKGTYKRVRIEFKKQMFVVDIASTHVARVDLRAGSIDISDHPVVSHKGKPEPRSPALRLVLPVRTADEPALEQSLAIYVSKDEPPRVILAKE